MSTDETKTKKITCLRHNASFCGAQNSHVKICLPFKNKKSTTKATPVVSAFDKMPIEFACCAACAQRAPLCSPVNKLPIIHLKSRLLRGLFARHSYL